MTTPDDGLLDFSDPERPSWRRHIDSQMQDFTRETLRQFIEEQMRQHSNAEEEMIERMLVHEPPCGIAVVTETKTEGSFEVGDWKSTTYRHYRLDEHLPFGYRCEFASLDEYRQWQENGHPINLDDFPSMLTDGEDGPISG